MDNENELFKTMAQLLQCCATKRMKDSFYRMSEQYLRDTVLEVLLNACEYDGQRKLIRLCKDRFIDQHLEDAKVGLLKAAYAYDCKNEEMDFTDYAKSYIKDAVWHHPEDLVA